MQFVLAALLVLAVNFFLWGFITWFGSDVRSAGKFFLWWKEWL